ncbi:MAG: hypothetical protein JWO95_1582 [Verrucomicrobiales bacterium]|nr:hypothetical protein [Verrucomicrobiales bacterium]
MVSGLEGNLPVSLTAGTRQVCGPGGFETDLVVAELFANEVECAGCGRGLLVKVHQSAGED